MSKVHLSWRQFTFRLQVDRTIIALDRSNNSKTKKYISPYRKMKMKKNRAICNSLHDMPENWQGETM